jgi:hypothetical protein
VRDKSLILISFGLTNLEQGGEWMRGGEVRFFSSVFKSSNLRIFTITQTEDFYPLKCPPISKMGRNDSPGGALAGL